MGAQVAGESRRATLSPARGSEIPCCALSHCGEGAMSMDFGYVECALHAAMRFAIYSIVHAPMRASTAGGLSTACLESTLGPCVKTRRGPERRSAPVHTHTHGSRVTSNED